MAVIIQYEYIELYTEATAAFIHPCLCFLLFMSLPKVHLPAVMQWIPGSSLMTECQAVFRRWPHRCSATDVQSPVTFQGTCRHFSVDGWFHPPTSSSQGVGDPVIIIIIGAWVRHLAETTPGCAGCMGCHEGRDGDGARAVCLRCSPASKRTCGIHRHD